MKQIEVIKKLKTAYPSVDLEEGETFYWSPSEKVVYYRPDNTTNEGVWALLHESGHALLDHTQYYSDIELVMMEVEAWEKAKEIAEELGVRGTKYEVDNEPLGKKSSSSLLTSHSSPLTINEDHTQDCLDSYRDWLHKRSLCPDCHLSGAQINPRNYQCLFCHKKWTVSADRFCRPYRRQVNLPH